MMNQTDKPGVINFHGKGYATVALRIMEFRDKNPNHCIHTEIVVNDGERVVMKSTIADDEGKTIGTGHAEEIRGGSGVNATSALENCETSAIGRALASCGYVSSAEIYASADEMQGAQERKQAMEVQRLELMEQVWNRNTSTVDAICIALDEGNMDKAAEAWMELERSEKKALWVAPTKAKEHGFEAPFTTKQRDTIKSDGFTAMCRNYLKEAA